MWPFTSSSARITPAMEAITGDEMASLVGRSQTTRVVAREPRAQAKLVGTNPIAYQIVTKLAAAVAQTRFYVSNAEDQPDWQHPLSQMLANPSTRHDGWQFAYLIAASLATHGRAYIHRVKSTRRVGKVAIPQELTFAPVDRVHKIKHASGEVSHYHWRDRNELLRVEPDDMLELRVPWLLDVEEGYSVVIPGADALETYAGINDVTRDDVNNRAMMPGVLNLEGLEVTEDQWESVKEQFDEFKRGGENTGKLALTRSFNGRWSLIPYPRNTDAISHETRTAALTECCNLWGYPAILLKPGEGATFANMREARRYLWEETIIPSYLGPITTALSKWLGVDIKTDLSAVPAVQDAQFDRLNTLKQANILTINELRSVAGYDPIDGGDILPMPANLIPLDVLAGALPASDEDDQDDSAELSRDMSEWLDAEGVKHNGCPVHSH